MLDTHRLRVFRSVVASGSVQSAAVNLGYTPSAVSQHITALARETGLTLFQRSGRGLAPTAAGLALARQADGVLRRIGEAEEVVADLRAGRTGALSLAYFASAGAMWLPGVVATMTARFPGVRLALRLAETVPDDPATRADIALCVAHAGVSPAAPGFTVHHLRDDPYVAALPAGHRLVGPSPLQLADLAGQPWVDHDTRGGHCRQILLQACSAAGFTPSFVVEANDYPTALAFVAAGVGVTVLPALGAVAAPAGVHVVEVVRPRPVRTIVVAVRDGVGDTPAAQAVLAALATAAAPPPRPQDAGAGPTSGAAAPTASR